MFITADCLKERASMILDTHTVFLIHVWTRWEEWQEEARIHWAILKQTTAETVEWNYALNAKKNAILILQRWTTNKHGLCCIDFSMDYIHHVQAMLLWSKEKSVLSLCLRNEIKSTACLCPLQILSAIVTSQFIVLLQEGQMVHQEHSAKWLGDIYSIINVTKLILRKVYKSVKNIFTWALLL